MAAIRPRIMFTPDEPTLLAIDRLATILRRPRSSIITENMAILAPHLATLADTLEAAMKLQGEALEAVQQSAEDAEETLAPLLVEAMGALERLRDVALLQPPSCNTGVTEPGLPLGEPV